MDPRARLPGWPFDRALSHAEIGAMRDGTPLQPDVSMRDECGDTELRCPSTDGQRAHLSEETSRG
jgi:hypothetical protein